MIPSPDTRQRAPAGTPRRRWPLILIGIALGLVFLSAVRVITGADDISSSGALNASLALAVPIGLAGLGGLWSERAGVVNIGLEGMMILGTWGAGFFGWQWGPWAGVLGGVALGALGGLLHAFTTVTFGVDHIVSGVAINILALGATQYLAAVAFSGKPGGSETRSPDIDDMPSLSIPGIRDPLGDLEAKDWFLISDLAAVVRSLTVNVNTLTIIAVALFVLTYFVLWRTVFGLRLRSCGESPSAAETLGVNVYRYKYYAVITSGALAGLGGAFLAIVASSTYQDGQTGGRGYIGLAAMIFGNWRPGGLGAGAGLFGYTNALQLRRGGESVHALLLVVAVLVLALALWQLREGTRRTAVTAGLFGLLLLAWYIATDVVAEDFTRMTPYVATLLVLAFASQRLRMPAADGQIYRRGQAG
ncbi:MAG: ABC transporter permease [Actinomycetes bacterium]